jgi:hypothetical protein
MKFQFEKLLVDQKSEEFADAICASTEHSPMSPRFASTLRRFTCQSKPFSADLNCRHRQCRKDYQQKVLWRYRLPIAELRQDHSFIGVSSYKLLHRFDLSSYGLIGGFLDSLIGAADK